MGGSTRITDSFGVPVTGELGGEISATQGPDIPCKGVYFAAATGNTGNVYIGTTDGVTVPNGTTDATSGFQLDSGQMSPWFPVRNLNEIYYICDGADDDLVYLAYQ